MSTGFPDSFLWGAATSAYQVEGSPLADGAGPSIWHHFSHTPGMITSGETGDVACDHYRRWREDVELMRRLGLRAYRFSISWSRILPDGTGRVNQRGLDFYRRLVDALLEARIAPLVTLYHWDLPAALDERGGWLSPDAASWFAEYAAIAARALADRVDLWTTLNEPWVISDAGYLHGVHAPGHRSVFEAPRVSLNLLAAHGAGVRALRSEGAASVGLVVNLEPKIPATDAPADRAAAERADAYWNRQFLDPVFLGTIPPELPEMWGEAWPEDAAASIEAARHPLDFLGINYYSQGTVRDDAQAVPDRAARVVDPFAPVTEMGWVVVPEALEATLRWVSERYGPLPLYLTENGAAFADPPTVDEGYVDAPRIAYLRDHLRAAHRAITAGVDLRGYFVWSLLDNFEWGLGTTKRFGIVHVDFASQRRTVKASGSFYSETIRCNGGSASAEGPG
jgi:beta-glucosidase